MFPNVQFVICHMNTQNKWEYIYPITCKLSLHENVNVLQSTYNRNQNTCKVLILKNDVTSHTLGGCDNRSCKVSRVRTFVHCWGEGELVQAPWETAWQFLKG